MILTYYFDRYEEEPFEYDASAIESEEYIKRTHSADEVIMDYIVNKYEETPEDFKEYLRDEFGFDGAPQTLNVIDDESKESIADAVIPMLIDIGVYDDELKDYFEDDAFTEYKDSEMSPYEYNGVSEKDF